MHILNAALIYGSCLRLLQETISQLCLNWLYYPCEQSVPAVLLFTLVCADMEPLWAFLTLYLSPFQCTYQRPVNNLMVTLNVS